MLSSTTPILNLGTISTVACARIEKSDFDTFADRLDLVRTYSSSDAKLELHWTRCGEPWWNPPNSLLGARFEHTNGHDYYAMAKYHEGYVYFVALGW